jgi:precorrin-6x reductase
VFESDWYRQDEGTVFVNQTSLSTVPQDFATVFRFNDATATNVLFIRKRSGFSQWVASGENSLFMTRTISQPSVLSVVYKTDDAAFAAEGTLTNDDSCTIDPNKVEVLIGSASGSTSYMNGTIRRLTYWPQRLPNETLQTITQ